MKKLFLLIFPALLISSCSSTDKLQHDSGQTDQLLTYSELITPEFLRSHLEVIAHDSLLGRDTGSEGERIAASYIIDHYTEWGIEPKGTTGYLQPFMLNAERTDSLVYRTYSVADNDTTWLSQSIEGESSAADFIRLFGGATPQDGEIVFAGFGVYDPARNVRHLDEDKIAGNWVLIFEEIPHVVNGDTLIDPRINNNARIGQIISQYNANGVLVISDMEQDEYMEVAAISSMTISNPENFRLQYLDGGRGTHGFSESYTMVSPEKAAEMLGLESVAEIFEYRESLKSDITGFSAYKTDRHLKYEPFEGTVEVESNNVIGYIEGGHPELKEEVIVLVAHYDHIGIGMPDEHGDMINNGADDNGSGTVALLNIAKAMQQAANDGYRPDRSVLFLHVSAEEKGLLGSRYYSDHPVIPIENTAASFNADMIGRSDDRNIDKGDTDYVYLIGGHLISSELENLVVEANNKSVSMRLDDYYNDLNDPNQLYRRSDHWNFGRLEVPFVFFFTGLHEDYHRPGDTVDKIDFEKLSRITKLIHASTIKTANAENRPEVDNDEFVEITRRMAR